MSEVRYFQHDAEYREHLRKPFDPAQVGKLPRVTDKTSAEAWCETCRQKLKRHIHIDFVGHANVTDRLNHEAPDWAYTIDRIETVQGHILGVLGTMTIGGKSVHEAGAVARQSDWGEELKLAVSDFIVRGAMRFGVGLDMWIKGDAADYQGSEPDGVLRRNESGSDRSVTPHPAGSEHTSDEAGPSPSDEAEEVVPDEPVPPASAPPLDNITPNDENPLLLNAGALLSAREQLDRVVTLYGGQSKAIRAAWEMFGIEAKDLPSLVGLTSEQAEQMIRVKGGL